MERPRWIVVGGRRRLGAALAEDLARDHALVLTSSRSWEGDAWLEGLGKTTGVDALQWDARDPRMGSRMMADLEDLERRGMELSGAILMAGDFPEMHLGTWSEEDLESVWRMHLTFPFLVAQALASHLAPGACLQFVLDSAIHKPLLKRLPYSAARLGQSALVAGLARALAPDVRVVGHALGTLMPDAGSDPEALAARSLLQRNGTAEDLARAVRYAAASPYLTGEILTLDGGWRLR
ncbi:MAG TPA: SDR family oxidoreductase [Holophagaceae bacterium]|nr:SDR family oxidoreductase [Holophagaceae bacterium]